MMRTTLLLLLMLPGAAWAGEALLQYQGSNQWVAEADNAPLRKLMTAAKNGKTDFTVTLPSGDKALHQARLKVLLDLLDKQRQGSALTFTEASGKTPSNTLKVRW